LSIAKENIGTCALCREVKELQESHIIPKFINLWQKKTSATGYLRHSRAVNQRVQDGYKDYLLCFECEQLFGRYEKKYAEKVFYPYQNHDNKDVEYGEWLLKFSTSVTWRILTLMKKQKGHIGLSLFHSQKLSFAEKTWRQFLLGERNDIGMTEQHMILMGGIESTGSIETAPNINNYLMTTTDYTFGSTKKEGFIYLNMCGIVLLGFTSRQNPWDGSRIDMQGTLKIQGKKYFIPENFPGWINDRAERTDIMNKSMSPKQKQIVEDDFFSDIDRLLASKQFEAIQYDNDLKKKKGA